MFIQELWIIWGQLCLIQREMAKKFGGRWRFPNQNQSSLLIFWLTSCVSLMVSKSCISANPPLYLLLLCQMCDIDSISERHVLAQKKRNSLPCPIRTFKQRACNQRVVCAFNLLSIWHILRKNPNRPKKVAYCHP